MTTEAAVTKLKKFFASERRLPSYAEMCILFGFASKKAVFDLVNKLIAAGLLEKDNKGKLSPKQLFAIPTLGIIKAGYPSPGEALADDSIDLYEYLLKLPGAIFSLVVRGDSMIEEGINDGDVVIVEKHRQPYNGDVVAACFDNEWTIKYYRKNNVGVQLVPANPKYPVLFPKGDLLIGGVVISVIRKYH